MPARMPLPHLPLERKRSIWLKSSLPVHEAIGTGKVSRRPSRTKSLPKQTSSGGLYHEFMNQDKHTGGYNQPKRSSPPIRSNVLRSLVSSQDTIKASSNVRRNSTSDARSDQMEHPQRKAESPIRQTPRRIKSCMSAENAPPVRKPKRRVSFGRVEGVIVKAIARENKTKLWFSSDEYKTMREEALVIAQAIREKKIAKDSSNATLRGLEKFVDKEATTAKTARLSVLEHQDLTMYALASNRAVLQARETALLDALEAIAIQKESKILPVPLRRFNLNP